MAAGLGYACAPLLQHSGDLIVPLLTLVMLCMGLNLRPRDFIALRECRSALLLGVVLQFSVMPVMALLIASLLQLDNELTLGLLLVGCVAGGTSSNVMTYIAGGNLALSVSMTACSTLLGAVLTPLLLQTLVGTTVEVPVTDMLLSLFRIILVPVATGVTLVWMFPRAVNAVQQYLAPASVLAILSIIAIVVGMNAILFETAGLLVLLATLAHNVSGLMLGYGAARLLRYDETVCRTVAIEVGMQNSGLATALAVKFFTPASAMPGAVFSIWLNITGSIFAGLCKRLDQGGDARSSPMLSDSHSVDKGY
ncbi:bile acid:sodium symporter family protein [Parahaliea maris]|uniref:bile acid:sodium symporter family protein n=1 Tax=Parahaliea maris TaxID=2716870 RepID=UPI001F3ACD3B|nr:bile acid:sodium symporter family protein [Parahaliea maris]